jgi:glycosyltransferase involved in cell wall biosynthesis
MLAATIDPEPLRFLMLTTFYPPYSFGGDGVGIQRLCRALARRGHQVTVVHDQDAFRSLHKGAPPSPAEEPEGITVIGLRSRLGSLSALLTQQTGRPIVHGRRLRRIARDGRFDVINFHNISLVGGPGLLSLGDAVKLYMAHEHWLVCPSHVLWRHGRERCDGRQCLRCVLHYKRPPQLWRYTGFLERQLRHVDAFIAMSEFSRAKHAEFGFPRDMEVLPYLRDYYKLVTHTGLLVVIFQDLVTGDWYLERLYD